MSTADLLATGREFFESVEGALRGLVGHDAHIRWGFANVKLWFDEPREHYEVQWLDGRDLEVGFHAEHRDEKRNQAALDRILAGEATWRTELGDEAEAGAFLGGLPANWRRVSELWPDTDLADVDLAMEAADRLASYAAALEPFRSSEHATMPRQERG